LLDTEPVAFGDLILTEVLQGFRNDTDFRKAQAFLAELPFYELGGYAVCLQAARNYRALRAKGMTVHKTIDVIIATACIKWNFELLHTTGTSTLCKDPDYGGSGKMRKHSRSCPHRGTFAREMIRIYRMYERFTLDLSTSMRKMSLHAKGLSP
jgi:hypothetical protein